jgi:Tfp pilus assembly protein PilW
MLMSARPPISDERGSTMIELLVGMAMGMIVLVGLTMVIIVTLHGNARVDARVEATQNARLTITKIMEELHSACVSPKIAPVKSGSSETSLIFWHAAPGQAEAVEPIPVESVITYGESALWQTDKVAAAGPNSEWIFPKVGATQKLLDNVALPAGGRIFTYYRYQNGKFNESPLGPTLNEAEANETILVQVALAAEPASNPVRDPSANATISDSATLRLTPPSFNETVAASPCQ